MIDDTDKAIMNARLKEMGWPHKDAPGSHLHFSETPDPLFTVPVYIYSTLHGASVSGLDVSHETLHRYAQAVQEHPELKDEGLQATYFVEALTLFRLSPESPDLWEHLSRCIGGYVFSSPQWRQINRIKRENNDDRHIHFCIVYDNASGNLGKTAMLNPQPLLPKAFVEQFARQGLSTMGI